MEYHIGHSSASVGMIADALIDKAVLRSDFSINFMLDLNGNITNTYVSMYAD